MALPTYTTVLAQVKTAIKEVTQVIEAADAVSFSFYTQAQFPYWTIALTQYNVAKAATGRYDMTLRAQVFLHLDWLTSGLDGEAEERAQVLSLLAAITFAERPQLQCTTYPRGVSGINPIGLSVTQAGLGRVDTGEGNGTRAVVIDLQIPITFSLDTKG